MSDGLNWQEEEWESIHQRRQQAFSAYASDAPKERPKNLVGLALSGGGIRSALYNDGFLQGLSHRGFLRFVDYLASVSGGGYIAGHLASQAKDADESRAREKDSFHDDDDETHNTSQRWHLGRDPKTGKVDADRLAGIGGYLSRPLELLPAYLWSCFFSAAFYLGISGVFATLAALFWRTFDSPDFRTMYATVLGLRFGSELFIAFIPVIGAFVLYLVFEGLISFIRLLAGFDKPRLQLWHTKYRACSLVLLSMTCLTSVAIFLGNGTTNIRANAPGALYLNHYAQWLAILAGVLQLMIFFGSNRLFRSEREEAQSWQKHLQRSISVGVTMFLVFAIVHWMGRENISRFVEHREPYLIRGDIGSWQPLLDVFANEPLDASAPTRELDPKDGMPPKVVITDSWQEALAARRLGWLSEIDADELQRPTEGVALDSWMLEDRVLAACYTYWLTEIYEFKEADPTLAVGGTPPTTNEEKAANENASLTPTVESVYATVKSCIRKLNSQQTRQTALLEEWNKELGSPQFTLTLLDRILRERDTRATSGGLKAEVSTEITAEVKSEQRLEISVRTALMGFLNSNNVGKSQSDAIATAVHRLMKNPSLKTTSSGRQSYAAVNRTLLELLFPTAVRKSSVASTYVIQPYDQRARLSWLKFWLLMATIGALGGVFRLQIATVFSFYRRQIGSNFLVRSSGNRESRADTPLCQLDPTVDGLPYPLILAASLSPVTVNGSYTVMAKPFLFTPKRTGHFEDAANCIATKQVSLAGSYISSSSITLAEAVTLSAAAVSPLMTKNRSLSILVDFFNTGLGRRVYRTERTETTDQKGKSHLLWFYAICVSLLCAALVYVISDYDFTATLATFVMTGTIGICVISEAGVPHFLHTLAFPPELGPHTETTRKTKSATSFYVADGGFSDYLGVSALLERKCELIVVSDAGANIGSDHLGTLARMCEKASEEMGIRFLDLDHEAPIDFGRLQYNEQRVVHQPHLCMRIRYSDGSEGLLIYCQMAITEQDPIEIKQIRNRFPTFPDEPTINQFYTNDQVVAYRALGYHIATKLCRELERWELGRKQAVVEDTPQEAQEEQADEACSREFADDGMSNDYHRFCRALSGESKDPLFLVLCDRLLTAYRLACYEEISYRKDDIFSEAVWNVSTFAFPNFGQQLRRLRVDASPTSTAALWLEIYENSADVRSVYRKAIVEDTNIVESAVQSFCHGLWLEMCRVHGENLSELEQTSLLAAHLAVIGTACQEVHRGRPHSAFQIGGRRKLLDLCYNIAEVVVKSLATNCTEKRLDAQITQILAEVLELERSVFQGSERVTIISFSQCVCFMWGCHCRKIEAERRATNSPETNLKSEQHVAPDSVMLQARQSLDVALRYVRLKGVRLAFRSFWLTGYQATIAAEVPAEEEKRAVPK